MYDYFTNGRGLNNLIWVAAFSGEPKADWHPGAAYVDIGGPDTYVKNHDNLVTPSTHGSFRHLRTHLVRGRPFI
jgi:mannan endo-1,4-beta-mannosidase